MKINNLLRQFKNPTLPGILIKKSANLCRRLIISPILKTKEQQPGISSQKGAAIYVFFFSYKISQTLNMLKIFTI